MNWTPSINLGIKKRILTWVFAILTGYCHSGNQRGKLPTQMRAGRPDSEGEVGGAGSSQMKMWSSPGWYEVIGHAPTRELYHVENQCDKIWSLKPTKLLWHVKDLYQLTWEYQKWCQLEDLQFWPGIITLVPNEEAIPCKCGQEKRRMKEAWEWRDPAEWRCDVAQDNMR